MTTVGIYVDGPNMERGLFEAGELRILERVGSVLKEYAQGLGEVVDADVFLDEATLWRSQKTREDYELNGFRFRETRSFKHIDVNTGAISFGKSLTDPSMHCALVDRLHDPDCPDILVLVTGDKDITVAMEYISMHHKEAVVVGEANSISSFLISKCEDLGFGCHVLQLMAPGSRALEGLADKERRERKSAEELRVTDGAGKPLSVHKYLKYRNDRSNQRNPNNIAYWRSRGYRERPPDWEDILKREREKEPE
ncbi:MAG: NYN domain-containing protein [Methanomassiliicoccus sp.]|nr:NYN domain-containing protein [Methanomassiliicoccus sp.]